MAPNNSKLKSLKPHPEYHMPGDVTIIVDAVSFCFSSYFLTRESSEFRERINSSPDPDVSGDKKSDSHCQHKTIIIQPEENVTPDDFAKLCWVFFNEKYSIYEAPLATWETILRLANQYGFTEVKDLAFRQLEVPGKFELSLVERIVLYRKHTAERKYLERLYVELLSRPEALTLEEGSTLGMTSALIISGARERLRAMSERLSLSDPLPTSMKKTTQEMVVSIFWNGPLPDLSQLNGTTTGNFKDATAITATSSSNFNSTSIGTSTSSNSTPEASKPLVSIFGSAVAKKGRK